MTKTQTNYKRINFWKQKGTGHIISHLRRQTTNERKRQTEQGQNGLKNSDTEEDWNGGDRIRGNKGETPLSEHMVVGRGLGSIKLDDENEIPGRT